MYNFVSTGFSGNSSDRFVVENSGLLDVLRPRQRILADHGFTARDLIVRNSAFLTIPSFLRGASKLTGQQAMETYTVASVRIHVEDTKDFCLLSAILLNRMNKRILDNSLCFVQFPTTTHHVTIYNIILVVNAPVVYCNKIPPSSLSVVFQTRLMVVRTTLFEFPRSCPISLSHMGPARMRSFMTHSPKQMENRKETQTAKTHNL